MNEEILKLVIKEPKVAKKQTIGTIYAFVNKQNSKIYIGKTIQPYLARWDSHKCNAFTKTEVSYFYNALRKYSWDGFMRIVIYQTEELPKNEADLIVCEKEKFYINLFRTDNHDFGYNLTKGGEGVSGIIMSKDTREKMSESHKGEKHWNFGNTNGSTSDAVLQFDLDFNFIQEWPSMIEIERQLKYKANNISRCCANKIDTYKGFIWAKKEHYFDGYLQKFKSRAKCKSNDKEVLQYDNRGNFVKSYISCSEAARQLNKRNPSMIQKAAKGTEKQAYKFIWIYKEDFSENKLKERIENIQK